MSLVPCPLGPQEINGLRVSPCNAYKLLTDHLITGLPLKRSEPARKSGYSQTIHIHKP